MNRRRFAIASALLPIANSMSVLALDESTPTLTESFPDWIQQGATWADSRSRPSIWYMTRMSLQPWRADNQSALGPPQHYVRNPWSYIQEEFGIEVVRAISPVEFILPPQGEVPRHDAAFWVKRDGLVGPCILSSIGGLMIEQAAVTINSARSGMSTPADACILGPLERATDAGWYMDPGQLMTLFPTDDELGEAGLTTKLSEFFTQE